MTTSAAPSYFSILATTGAPRRDVKKRELDPVDDWILLRQVYDHGANNTWSAA